MIRINLVCVGGLKEKYWREAEGEYLKRLGRFCKIRVTEVPEHKLSANPSAAEIEAGIKIEGERILEKLGNSAVVALCIEGESHSSERLSERLDKLSAQGVSDLAFVIGGSNGLFDEVKKRAVIKLSLSKMTFPHQMARIVMLEQIYRCMQISTGGKYHK